MLLECAVLQIVVASKFDNRLKEFAEKWEVDRYLSASGYLHQNVKPFFVALPKVGGTIYSMMSWLAPVSTHAAMQS